MEKILYIAMLTRIEKEIKENAEEIENLKKIDSKYSKMQIEIKKFLEIVEHYKEKNIQNENKEIMVYCNGNPYILLNLVMIAITNNMNMKINIDNTMLGVNKLLLKIINDILKENKLNIQIEISNEIQVMENTIFIDRINDYNVLKNKVKNIKFIPYESLDVYLDSDEFDELFETIYNIAINSNIDIDIFEEDEGIENLIKYGKGRRKLILTKQKNIAEKYIGENIYINENPFKDEKIIFDEDIISCIIK